MCFASPAPHACSPPLAAAAAAAHSRRHSLPIAHLATMASIRERFAAADCSPSPAGQVVPQQAGMGPSSSPPKTPARSKGASPTPQSGQQQAVGDACFGAVPKESSRAPLAQTGSAMGQGAAGSSSALDYGLLWPLPPSASRSSPPSAAPRPSRMLSSFWHGQPVSACPSAMQGGFRRASEV
jgi:hypothetical protein